MMGADVAGSAPNGRGQAEAPQTPWCLRGFLVPGSGSAQAFGFVP